MSVDILLSLPTPQEVDVSNDTTRQPAAIAAAAGVSFIAHGSAPPSKLTKVPPAAKRPLCVIRCSDSMAAAIMVARAAV